MPLSSPPGADTAAAIDLGSNSFHLLLARFAGGEMHVVDRLKERVQLAAGLTEDKHLDHEAQERALGCLRRFAELVQHLPRERVTAVGTSTLRQLRDDSEFVMRASEVLGHPIEVISGHEEARLIYLGIAHTLPGAGGNRLVVDIGGGSTEVILGEGFHIFEADSLHMGCVAYSLRFFPGGKITEARMVEAEKAAALELHSMRHRYRARGWESAVGSSGTILAVDSILRETKWGDGGITVPALKRLRAALIESGHEKKLTLPGLKDERRGVLSGGLAILRSVLEVLGVERMTTSEAALREGALYELRGRIENADIREVTVASMMERFHVDPDHAARVERTALALFDQVAPRWSLDARDREKVAWAARLHEVGLALSHGRYHKHGGYILRNTDMAGFSRDGQELIACLVEGHRRKVSRSIFANLPEVRQKAAMRLCVLLRLSRRLHRARSDEPLPPLALEVSKKKLRLSLPAEWLEANSVTALDLDDEKNRLAVIGFDLEVVRV